VTQEVVVVLVVVGDVLVDLAVVAAACVNAFVAIEAFVGIDGVVVESPRAAATVGAGEV
jgi:hypothetical protein